MGRAIPTVIGGVSLRLISIEDLVARTGRLCMDLANNMPIPAKHARDFLRLLPFADVNAVEPVWQEHRKPMHPKSFRAAADLLMQLIATRADLQIIPGYSCDTNESCPGCEGTASFALAAPERILSVLGYC
jgi:hypothetical protein